MTPTVASMGAPATLRRVLGRWDLVALGINQVIGGAIFLVPAQIAAHAGNWSPYAYVAAGVVTLVVALCFAEVGSRFERTGGTYVYARAAFGSFVGFEVGWMQWFTRASSQASIVSGIALALAFYWPAAASGLVRAAIVGGITLALALVNVRGARESALVIDALAVAKLTPLLVFIAAGVFAASWGRLLPLPSIEPADAAAAALLLVFAFGGFDTLTVVAGESSNPRSDVPFALVTTVLAVTAIMALVQIVTMTTLADVTTSTTPVADAAMAFMGQAGALMIGVGSVVSMLGNNAGGAFNGSRVLYALAADGELPRRLARVHPVSRTPVTAIWCHTAIVLGLALSGSFAVLATASAVARLITYTAASLATLTLRAARFQETVPPPRFVAPFGRVLPIVATVASAALIFGASPEQLVAGAAVRAACRLAPAAAGR